MRKPDRDCLRGAVLGCGAVTERYYAPALRAAEEAGAIRVHALLDPDAANLARLGAVFPQALRFADFEELRASQPDFAIIASPPRYHADQAIALLNARVSVLCEKPMAPSVAEGEAILHAAEASGTLLAVGMVRRFLPATDMIRNLLSGGVIGPLRSFSCFEGGPFTWPSRSGAYLRKDAALDPLLDIGVHLLDLLVWWFGEPASIRYQDDACGGVAVNCRLELEFADFGGEARISRDWPRPNRYVFRGSSGSLSWTVNDADRIQLNLHQADGVAGIGLRSDQNAAKRPVGPAFSFEQSFLDQILNFTEAIRGRTEIAVPGREALRSLRLAERCRQNATLISMPWLSDRESARAFNLRQARGGS
jgi:myo-inositol 2-dehydrogenase / D-chiro-inositol 1-dehydrogenase